MTEYVWDYRNRLVAVIDRLSEDGPILQSVEYVFDSQNRWIGKSVDPDGDGPEEAVEIHFVYQGNQIILQVDEEGEVSNRYLWRPAVDQILADEQVEGDGNSEVLWPLTDHLNTVRDLAVYEPDADVTTVLNHIVYDAFGRVTAQTDPPVTTLFGFTARPFDSDTGLQNNLNRWYDAETGTWISVDPIGFAAADANLYRYVGNEVTVIVDPAGLAPPPSGFFGSWGASWTSMQNTYTSLILEHYYGLPHEAHDFMEQAYETGPLGQTKDSGPITKYGTRGALGVATAAVMVPQGIRVDCLHCAIRRRNWRQISKRQKRQGILAWRQVYCNGFWKCRGIFKV